MQHVFSNYNRMPSRPSGAIEKVQCFHPGSVDTGMERWNQALKKVSGLAGPGVGYPHEFGMDFGTFCMLFFTTP